MESSNRSGRYYEMLFDKYYQDEIRFDIIASKFLAKKYQEHELFLTPNQIKQLSDILKRWAIKSKKNDLIIQINNYGDLVEGKPSGETTFSIDLSEISDDEIVKALEEVSERVQSFVDDQSEKLYKKLKAHLKKQEKELHGMINKFKSIVSKTWEEPLMLLDLIIRKAEETGSEFHKAYLQRIGEIVPPKYDALVHLHARSLQISKEISILLHNGFADGADARWRTLHEVSVDANLLHIGDDQLAQRYIDHEAVQAYKDALIYQEHHKKIGFAPFYDDELDYLKNQYENALNQYGEDFQYDYGWAAGFLNKKRPRFTDLENQVDLSKMRPFYRMANINVHSSSRGLVFRLGLTKEMSKKIMLAGASDVGLGDPIQNTAYSLMLTSVYLLTHEPDFDNLIYLNALDRIQCDLLDAVGKVINEQFPNEFNVRNSP